MALGKIGKADERILPALIKVSKSDPNFHVRLMARRLVPVVENMKIAAVPVTRFRTWSDTTGRFKTKAGFVRMEGREVVLNTADGRTIRVPVETLSPTDMQYSTKTIHVRIPKNPEGITVLKDRARVSLGGHRNHTYCVEFSNDGRLIASGSYDETIKIWDAATGVLLRELEGFDRSARIYIAVGAAIYMTIPFTEPLPAATLLVLAGRFFKNPPTEAASIRSGEKNPADVRDRTR